jgi:3'-phosphoadenosine 5'-phosphosulfate sulfotransferase (PAPS reductase)/FAD synthetase
MSAPALFNPREALQPAANLEHPTPADAVAALSPKERTDRVLDLIKQANQILQDALNEHLAGRELAGVVLLFSGGNDSTILGHLFRHQATHAAHANTGIGIEQTRQFVRETCEVWELPLMEKHPPKSYRDLVLEEVDGHPRGFPGPALHWLMYTRLKERCLDQVRRELVTNGRRQRVVFLAGRRRSESARRQNIALHERRDSVVWVSPLANWTKLDLGTYRQMFSDVPQNRVTDLIHMSGECLCGAFAAPGELEEIRFWFPEAAAQIDALAAELAAAGVGEPRCRWGHGEGRASERQGLLCSSCQLQQPDLFTAEETA